MQTSPEKLRKSLNYYNFQDWMKRIQGSPERGKVYQNIHMYVCMYLVHISPLYYSNTIYVPMFVCLNLMTDGSI